MGASATNKRHVNQRQWGKLKACNARWVKYILVGNPKHCWSDRTQKSHFVEILQGSCWENKKYATWKPTNKKQWNGLFNNTQPTSCANSTKTNKTKATSNGGNSKPETSREWKWKQNYKKSTTGWQIGNEIGQKKRSNEKFRCSKLEVETAPLPQAHGLQKVGVLGYKTWNLPPRVWILRT